MILNLCRLCINPGRLRTASSYGDPWTWPCLGDLGGLRLRPPAPLANHVIRPALAAADQVLALGIWPRCSWQVSTGMRSARAWCLNQWQVMQTLRLRLARSTPSSNRARLRSRLTRRPPPSGLPLIETAPFITLCAYISTSKGEWAWAAPSVSCRKGAPGHGRPGPLEPVNPWWSTAPRSWLTSAARRKGCRNPSGPHAIPFARFLPFLSALSAVPAADAQLVQTHCPLRSIRRSGLPRQ